MNNKTININNRILSEVKEKLFEVLSKYNNNTKVNQSYGEIYVIEYDLDTNDAYLYDAGEFILKSNEYKFNVNEDLNIKEIIAIKKVINKYEFVEFYKGKIFISEYRLTRFELTPDDIEEVTEILRQDELQPGDFADPDDYDDYIKDLMNNRYRYWDEDDNEGLIVPDGRLLFIEYSQNNNHPYIVSEELSKLIKYTLVGGN